MTVSYTHLDVYKRQPLFSAVHWMRKDKVKLLIENGADVNVRNNLGETPLFYTTDHKNTDIVKLLIDHGANVKAKDNLGQNVLFIDGVLKQIPPMTKLSGSSYERVINKDVLKLLIENGTEVNTKNDAKETPFSVWEKRGNNDIIDLLNQYNAPK